MLGTVAILVSSVGWFSVSSTPRHMLRSTSPYTNRSRGKKIANFLNSSFHALFLSLSQSQAQYQVQVAGKLLLHLLRFHTAFMFQSSR